MTIQMRPNHRNLPEVELDISVDEDDAGRIGLTIDFEGGGENFAWYVEVPEDIETFFRMVDEAQADYRKLKDDGKV